MPVLIALVQALTDSSFDLYGVQATGGLAAPVCFISGPIVSDLNLNFSYSTAGPGWRANSTIGRAMRLILINIGQAWPGINDMKDVGNPAKFGIVIVENEVQTPKGWTMLREQEGFPKGVSTVSVYASQSYRQVMKHSIKPYIEEATFEQMKTALTADASQWGEELVFVLSPSLAEALARAGYTVEGLKTALFEEGRVPRKLFGPRPLGAIGITSGIPKWIDELPDNYLVPIVPSADHIKLFVAGGRGPGASFMIDQWGFGNSHFTTKEIKLPANWKALVSDLKGWETPIEVK